MAVLCAYGLDSLMKRHPFRAIKLKHVLLGVLVVGLAILLARSSPFAEDTPLLNWFPPVKTFLQPLLLLVVTGLLLRILVAGKHRYRQGAAIAIIALSFIDLLDFGLPIYSRELTSPGFYQTGSPKRATDPTTGRQTGSFPDRFL